MHDNLNDRDFRLVELFFTRFDNANLLTFLGNHEAELNPLGALTTEMFTEFVKKLEEQDVAKEKRFPSFYKEFIPAFRLDQPIFPGLSWEDQLTTLYFNSAMACDNPFIASWFEFNLAITNIFTAVNSRNFALELSSTIVGNNELAETMRNSNSKDFGIAPIFPYLEQVLKIIDEPNLLEREKKSDLLKWHWIEEHVFQYHFSIENIFAYLLQTEIIERWIDLDAQSGKKIFTEFIDQLKGSFQFTDEYKLNK